MVYANYPKLFSGANKPLACCENRDLLSVVQVLVYGRFRRGTCLCRLILGLPYRVKALVYGRLKELPNGPLGRCQGPWGIT